MDIKINDILKEITEFSPIKGFHRVLWVNPKANVVVTIEIPICDRNKPYPRFFLGPRKHTLSILFQSISLGYISVEKGSVIPPLAHLSDAEIREQFPIRRSTSKHKVRTDSAILQKRDADWILVEPIIDYIRKYPELVFEDDELTQLINKRSFQTKTTRKRVYNAVNRVLALGCGKNSLLYSFHCSGGKGKMRSPRSAEKLGRKSLAFLNGNVEGPGIHICEEDKRRIQNGWNTFLRKGRTVKEAYRLTLGAFWSEGTKIHDGKAVPILLPASQCPSFHQFRYWGPKDDNGKSAFEIINSHSWKSNYREKLGSQFDGIHGVGQIGFLDATTNDQHLVSSISRLRAVGTCYRIPVIDAFSEMAVGLYCGFDAPSESTALLAMLNAAEDKSKLFERFDVKFSPDQMPATQFARFIVDNGEARTVGTFQVLNNLGIGVEYVESYRGDRKGPVESQHKSIHRIIDNKGEGRTRGRMRSRGEIHSAISACWTWFDYMRQLLKAILYFNCELNATSVMNRHPFRTAMIKDGVRPVRKEIYQWCVENNKIASPSVDLRQFRAMFLPKMKAVIKRNGVFLVRPDRGNKIELIQGCRFSGPISLERGWHSGKVKSASIDVYVNPSDLTNIWYADDQGIHEMKNLSNDILLLDECCLRDALDLQDFETENRQINMSRENQAHSDLLHHTESVNDECKRSKKNEILATGRKISKAELKANIKENRAIEGNIVNDCMKNFILPPSSSELDSSNLNENPKPAENISTSGIALSVQQKALKKFRSRRKSHE